MGKPIQAKSKERRESFELGTKQEVFWIERKLFFGKRHEIGRFCLLANFSELSAIGILALLSQILFNPFLWVDGVMRVSIIDT